LDVDGVLSDGSVVYAEYGDELKRFDVQDGAGLVWWHLSGFKTAVISGRKSKAVDRRAKELRIDHLSQGITEKLPVYERLLKRWKLSDAQVCVVGDDLTELPLLRRAGLSVAVPNAVEDVKGACHYTTQRPGGRGAVREVITAILQAKGIWEDWLDKYR
jgi:3-deoxy-D-manno-octulosonate 8-phosphate phosphatase (KDO 8-P phosphatase)